MKLRLIPVTLACAALASGFVTVSAQASTVGTHNPASGPPALSGMQPGARVPGASGVSSQVGAITGVVAGTGRQPVAGACVVATGSAGSAMAMTGPNGRYTLNPLRPGKYTLHFSDCAQPGR